MKVYLVEGWDGDRNDTVAVFSSLEAATAFTENRNAADKYGENFAAREVEVDEPWEPLPPAPPKPPVGQWHMGEVKAMPEPSGGTIKLFRFEIQ